MLRPKPAIGRNKNNSAQFSGGIRDNDLGGDDSITRYLFTPNAHRLIGRQLTGVDLSAIFCDGRIQRKTDVDLFFGRSHSQLQRPRLHHIDDLPFKFHWLF